MATTTATAALPRRIRSTLPRVLATLPSLPTAYPTASGNAPSSSSSSSSSSTAGEPILVQPVEWQQKFPDSFFRVYRTKLRVKTPGGAGRVRLGAEGVRGVLGGTGPSAATTGQQTAQEQLEEELENEQEQDEEEEDLFALAESSEEGGNEPPRTSQSSAEVKAGTSELPPGVQVFGKAWGVLFWKGKAVNPTRTTYELSPEAIRRRYPHIRTDGLASDPTARSSTRNLASPPPALPTLPTPYVPAALINPRLALPMTRAAWRVVPPAELSSAVLDEVRRTHAGPRLDGAFTDREWNMERVMSRADKLKRKNLQRREHRRGTVVAGAQ